MSYYIYLLKPYPKKSKDMTNIPLSPTKTRFCWVHPGVPARVILSAHHGDGVLPPTLESQKQPLEIRLRWWHKLF